MEVTAQIQEIWNYWENVLIVFRKKAQISDRFKVSFVRLDEFADSMFLFDQVQEIPCIHSQDSFKRLIGKCLTCMQKLTLK